MRKLLGPPRAAEWLLRVALRLMGESALYVVGDLREEYAAQRAGRGRLPAGVWYVASVFGLVSGLWWERWRDGRTRSGGRVRRSSETAGGEMRTELKQALRFLSRRPGFSSAIVLTVALAIAATTVAYAVVDGVLLEPLPYADPEGIVVVWERNIPRDRETNVVSPANYLAWRDRARSFSDLASSISTSQPRTGAGEPERIGVVQVTPSFFRVFGASALIGRLFAEEDGQPGGPTLAVLSEGYWRRAFGGDASVIGSDIVLGGSPYTVIGVLPSRFDVPIAAEFSGTGTHDAWVAARWDEAARSFSGRFLQVFGRLAPGVGVAAAHSEMREIAASLREEFPVRQAGWDANVVSLSEYVVGDVRTTLLVIFGAVCFVLLIACGNVANLLLTRASARQQEMAVRSALGSGRGRLVRQLMLESLLLSVFGGLAGVALAYVSLRGLIAAAPEIPRIQDLALDGSVLGFALAATIVTALLFGLAPALHIAGGDLASWLKDRGAAGTRRAGNRLRAALVVVQVALSLVLLVGAGLLMRSFAKRLSVGLGFNIERLLTAELAPPANRYDREATVRFFEELVARVQALPGVTRASAITFVPLAGEGSATSFWPTDRPVAPPGEQHTADIRWVHADYASTMGIPVVAGRFFDPAESPSGALRVVINEAGARTLWPGESAVGKQIAMPWGDTLYGVVVGVVGDVMFNGPETELRPMLYWDHRQERAFQQMTLVIRTRGSAAEVVSALRAAVSELDPNLPLYNVRTMDDLYGDALARPRFATISLGVFAALALLLAGVGIYGVIAYATQQRSREIGIRLALGANRSDVIRMVLGQGALLIGVAVGIGAAGALGLTRLLQGLVFDVSTTDPLTFAGMTLLLAAVALLACWLPARRASAIPPVEAIRNDN